MKYKRTIRFQYYQIKYICEDELQNPKYKLFNLPKWIKMMEDNDMIKKAIEHNGLTARIEKCMFNPTSKLYGIHLMKLRDTNIPSKVKDLEEASAIELEEDEYIGEDLFMLYDDEKNISMIQQNRMSMGISRVEEFIEGTYNKYSGAQKKISINIAPILSDLSREKLKKGQYRMLELSFDNINGYHMHGEKRALSELLNPFKKFGGISGNIKIGLSRTKYSTLNKDKVNELVDELNSNKRYVRSAKIKIKEQDDSDIEIIDLFDDVVHDFIEFSINVRSSLTYEAAIYKMELYYKERKGELNKLVSP